MIELFFGGIIVVIMVVVFIGGVLDMFISRREK